MIRLLFALMVLLALLGDVRIFLFILNRFVFGDHREEHNPWNFLIWAMPPVLLALTGLFWPLNIWVERLLTFRLVEAITPDRIEAISWSEDLARLGAIWMIAAASVGLYWLVDRVRELAIEKVPLDGIRDAEPTLIRLRRPHVPSRLLRRLGAHNDVYDIEVTRHEVFVDGLPEEFDGYRIAFLTDTHVASFMRGRFYEAIAEQVRAFDPDAVLLGGDFVSFTRHIPLMGKVLGPSCIGRDGTFAILGNHDYWAGPKEVQATLEAHGVQFVTNRNLQLRRGDATINLLGIDEIYRGQPDVEAAFAGVDPAAVAIGISHHPDILDLLEGRRLDLLVCGHTHGGQIRFPFFGAIVVPSKHEQAYAAGFVRTGNVLLYVSRGIGSIPPLRILCRPEVATFTLRRGARR
jgi:predicted MPP superfamily phosphohydrolase